MLVDNQGPVLQVVVNWRKKVNEGEGLQQSVVSDMKEAWESHIQLG